MKILKYTLGIIALLVLIFLAIGFIKPSISYTSEITVEKPITEAWAVMSDESKLSEWLKGMTKIEHVSGEKGAVGAVTNYTYIENGEESIITETITSVTPNQQITMSFVMEGVMLMDYKIEFKEKEGKTKIQSFTKVKGDGMIMRSMMVFMAGAMQTQEDVNMNNLKKVINENTSNYFPDPLKQIE